MLDVSFSQFPPLFLGNMHSNRVEWIIIKGTTFYLHTTGQDKEPFSLHISE